MLIRILVSEHTRDEELEEAPAALLCAMLCYYPSLLYNDMLSNTRLTSHVCVCPCLPALHVCSCVCDAQMRYVRRQPRRPLGAFF